MSQDRITAHILKQPFKTGFLRQTHALVAKFEDSARAYARFEVTPDKLFPHAFLSGSLAEQLRERGIFDGANTIPVLVAITHVQLNPIPGDPFIVTGVRIIGKDNVQEDLVTRPVLEANEGGVNAVVKIRPVKSQSGRTATYFVAEFDSPQAVYGEHVVQFDKTHPGYAILSRSLAQDLNMQFMAECDAHDGNIPIEILGMDLHYLPGHPYVVTKLKIRRDQDSTFASCVGEDPTGFFLSK